jgi:tRNA-uridine 2-sulfurtransferase
MKIAVGISGGVDSAVAAFLCKEKGDDVIGVTMKIWDGRMPHNGSDTLGNACFGPEEEHDIEDARKICETIGIPHYVIDCVEAFRQKILTYFRNTYLNGETPNPCVYCNQQLKFGLLPELLLKQNLTMDFFATGHYARIEHNPDGTVHLMRAFDILKDQSYFLHRLTHAQLRRSLFPLGNLTKGRVREIAQEANLHIWNKEESQDFYSNDYRNLIQEEKQIVSEGRIVNMLGVPIGTHKGIWNFTVGQRKGLGITGKKPLYVVDINAEKNIVVVGEEDDLKKSSLIISDFNQLEELPEKALCKVRSSSRPQACTVSFLGSSRAVITFDEPITGICPGQSAVLYDAETVVGGGVIERNCNDNIANC